MHLICKTHQNILPKNKVDQKVKPKVKQWAKQSYSKSSICKFDSKSYFCFSLFQSASLAQTCTLNGPKEWPKDLSPEARARRVAHVAHGAHGAGNGANGAKNLSKEAPKNWDKVVWIKVNLCSNPLASEMWDPKFPGGTVSRGRTKQARPHSKA